MSFSWTRVRAIVVKELRDYRHNRFVIGTMMFLPLLFTAAPIALDVANQFAGVFEGLGNSISYLAIDQTIPDPQTLSGVTWQGSVGLFGVVGAGGVGGVCDMSGVAGVAGWAAVASGM